MTHADITDQTSHRASSPTDESALSRKILLTVLMALLGWGLAIAQWGIPGLYMPAVALVPVMFVLLIAISRG